MIKGQVFANQLFENQIFALFINTFTDGKDGVSDNYKNGMAITYSGSDVTIDSGAVLIQGRFLEEDTSTTISAGADNMYCKLVIEIDLDKTNTTTEFNQGYYKIVKSSTTWPTLTQTNIVKNVSGIYQYELARFRTTANGITDFEDRRTFIDFDSIYDEIREHIQAIDDESIFVLKSGSTMTGKLIAEGGVEGDVEGNLTGNSATASKLSTARSITLAGDISGTTTFDGSANRTITSSIIKTNSEEFTVNANTSANGYAKFRFYRCGGVVQVEGDLVVNANKSGILITKNITDIMPSWAKIGRTNVNRTQLLFINECITDANGNRIGGVSIHKRVSGDYYLMANITYSSTSDSARAHAFTGTYVTN